jgi:hypothetical protein
MDGQEMLERSARWINGGEPLTMIGFFSEDAGSGAVATCLRRISFLRGQSLVILEV